MLIRRIGDDFSESLPYWRVCIKLHTARLHLDLAVVSSFSSFFSRAWKYRLYFPMLEYASFPFAKLTVYEANNEW